MNEDITEAIFYIITKKLKWDEQFAYKIIDRNDVKNCYIKAKEDAEKMIEAFFIARMQEHFFYWNVDWNKRS